MKGTKQAGILLSCILLFAGCTPISPIKILLSNRVPPAESSPPVLHLPISSDVLIFGGITTGLKSTGITEFYNVYTGKFLRTGSLPTKLAGLETTALGSGTNAVLAAGGSFLEGSYTEGTGTLTFTGSVTAAASLYNTQTGLFSASDAMVQARTMATATRLADGSVLIAGGFDPLGTPQRTAEIYQPGTGSFTAVNDMHMPRALHSATLLGNGEVLIAGGIIDTSGTSTSSAELYDPATRKFKLLESTMVQSSSGQSATVISGCKCARDGQVLLADGVIGVTSNGNQFELGNPAASLFDPKTRTFSGAAVMPTDARIFHSATLLPGGKVLLAGGLKGDVLIGSGGISGYTGNSILASAEIYDPVSSSFSCINGVTNFACNAAMVMARGGHVAALLGKGLNKGKVLLAGGLIDNGGAIAPDKSAELYDPAANTFSATTDMDVPRAFANAVMLP
jgi:Galactose oxidase, central domain